jgi:hypothetical protein
MESLLSLAFDNLSSFDGSKIKKGLKQVEGLLAQICLSGPSSPRKQSVDHGRDRDQPSRKVLADLSGDPAFREFFKLQEGFEWNIAQRLLTTLDWLVVRGGDGQYDLLIVNALDLIQGVLLLHPPSKVLFSRSVHMNVCLSLSLSHLSSSLLPSTHQWLTLSLSAPAPPRPPRTHQLPRHPIRHHHHPGRRPPRHAAQHARL